MTSSSDGTSRSDPQAVQNRREPILSGRGAIAARVEEESELGKVREGRTPKLQHWRWSWFRGNAAARQGHVYGRTGPNLARCAQGLCCCPLYFLLPHRRKNMSDLLVLDCRIARFYGPKSLRKLAHHHDYWCASVSLTCSPAHGRRKSTRCREPSKAM